MTVMPPMFAASSGSGSEFAGMEHLFSHFGHGMAILTAGWAALLLMTAHTVEMVGRLEAWFINMVELGVLQFNKIFLAEPITAVTVFTGNTGFFSTIGMTADTVGIGDDGASGVVMALLTTGNAGMHGVVKEHSAVNFR